MISLDKSYFDNFYVERKSEHALLVDGLRVNNNVFIEGIAGSGKTTFLTYFLSENPLGFSNILSFSGDELEFERDKIKIIKNSIAENNGRSNLLLVIDGFDEIHSSEVKNQIFEILRIGKQHSIKALITSRPLSDRGFLKAFDLVFKLSSLDSSQTRELILKRLTYRNFSQDLIEYSSIINDLMQGNPLATSVLADYIISNNANPRDVLTSLSREINYESSLNQDTSTKSSEDIEKDEEVKQDIIFINSNLVNKVKKDPKLMYDLPPSKFEDFVGEMFEKQGYTVTMTKKTHDGGKDLYIAQKNVLGDFLYYVECKRFRPDFPVGVKYVRELHGTITADRVTAGILVTSSYFSNIAKEYTEKVKHQLSLVDYIELQKWLKEMKK